MNAEILKALIKARKEFKPIKKDAEGAHKAKYATLDNIMDAISEALGNNGLFVSHSLDSASNSGFEGHTVFMSTIVYHESGDMLASHYPLPNFQDPQKMGSAITYARRYTLCALLGITADDDDDGASAKQAEKAPTKAKSNRNQAEIAEVAAKLETPVDTIRTIIKGLGRNSSEELTPDELRECQLRIMVGWGMGQGCFEAPQHCRSSLNKLSTENPQATMPEICDLWIDKVQHKLADTEAAQ